MTWIEIYTSDQSGTFASLGHIHLSSSFIPCQYLGHWPDMGHP